MKLKITHDSTVSPWLRTATAAIVLAFSSPLITAMTPAPDPTISQDTALSPQELAEHAERIKQVVQAVDETILIGDGVDHKLESTSNSPATIADKIADEEDLGVKAERALAIEATQLESGREAMSDSGISVVSSKVSIEDIQATKTPTGVTQIIAQTHTIRTLQDGMVWEEITPYVATMTGSSSDYTSLIIDNTWNRQDAPGTAETTVERPADTPPTNPTEAAPAASTVNAVWTTKTPQIIQAGISSSSKQAVANYALKWWNKRNPAFPSFSNDCTNFASQALLQGGWKTIPGYYQSGTVWNWNIESTSWTWSSSEHFYRFAVLNSKRLTNTYDRYVL